MKRTWLHNLRRFFDLGRTCGSFAADYLANRLSMQRDLVPYLRQALATSDGTVTADDVRRMRYYATYAPLGLGYLFASLRGKPLSERERLAQLWLMALTPIFDDYFDKPELYSLDRLRQGLYEQGEGEPENTHETMALTIWRNAKSKVPNVSALLELIEKVFAAQIAGNRQQDPSLTQAEIRQITSDKGGYAALLFRQQMDNPPSDAEQEVLYHLGAITQWSDDFFDVYEDACDGICTLTTTNSDLNPVRELYLHYIAETRQKVFALPYPAAQLRLFWDKYLFIFVRGQVAIEQLCALQAASGGVFHPKDHPRKALITDMEKWHNIRRAWQLFCE